MTRSLWHPKKGSLIGFLAAWMFGGIWGLVLLILCFQYGMLLWNLGSAQDQRLASAISNYSEATADVAEYRTSDPVDARRLTGMLEIESYPWPLTLTSLDKPVLYVSHIRGVLVRAAVVLREDKSRSPSDLPGRVLVQMTVPWHERIPSLSLFCSSNLSLTWLIGLAIGASTVIASGLLIAKQWLDITLQTPSQSFSETEQCHCEPNELQAFFSNARSMNRIQQDWVEEQRRFLDNASHQLRTPMAILLNQIQSAIAQDVPIKEVLPKMLNTTQRATHLIEQLLSLSKVEQFKRKGDLQPLALSVAAKSAVMDLSPLIAAKRLNFSLEGDGATVLADSLLLSELLKNLLTNAIHHTPRNGNMGIHLRNSVAHQGLVIWDEGPGIDLDLKDRLFQPFVASAGGTGLGLSICLQIAQAMKAEVRIFNRVKDGKTVGVDAVISWG